MTYLQYVLDSEISPCELSEKLSGYTNDNKCSYDCHTEHKEGEECNPDLLTYAIRYKRKESLPDSTIDVLVDMHDVINDCRYATYAVLYNHQPLRFLKYLNYEVLNNNRNMLFIRSMLFENDVEAIMYIYDKSLLNSESVITAMFKICENIPVELYDDIVDHLKETDDIGYIKDKKLANYINTRR